ncbi:8-amino-7-oxononanoate synthase [Methylobacillus flagellatus]|uniref:8-amino-7-oxononanoate synthase n=1 Tax=Methylobacillus flagellatus TaxID=405 RepID=UPI0010F6D5EC|nr:8-amino-7-oxononanoate synthase [Methylobacillus flagellatus]
MSDSLLGELKAVLDVRAAAGLLRRRRLLESPQGAHVRVDGAEVISFCSNDYLGLAQHPQLIAAMQQGAAEAGVGSGASHLITGHHRFHQALEQALAEFVAMPASLLFSTGYMANLGVITALLGRDDAIFADKLNHASLNDAAVLSRAQLHRFAHNDMVMLERQLAASTAKRKLVAVDAVFSMDGDLAPLTALLALCERYDAWLYLDDAHGFGVLGPHGQGAAAEFGLRSDRLIYMATLGKAAGVAGAFVAAAQVVIDYLQQSARSHVYTTAAPPALAATLLTALPLIAQQDWRRQHLHQLIAMLQSGLQHGRWRLLASATAIQPLLVGDNHAALALSEYLLARGLLVPAIRPPTVPAGTARLRISLSAAHTVDDVQGLLTALHAAAQEIAV